MQMDPVFDWASKERVVHSQLPIPNFSTKRRFDSFLTRIVKHIISCVKKATYYATRGLEVGFKIGVTSRDDLAHRIDKEYEDCVLISVVFLSQANLPGILSQFGFNVRDILLLMERRVTTMMDKERTLDNIGEKWENFAKDDGGGGRAPTMSNSGHLYVAVRNPAFFRLQNHRNVLFVGKDFVIWLNMARQQEQI